MSFYVSDGPVINVLRYDLNLNGNFKAILRRVRKSEDGHIVVVGSTPSVAELLRQVLIRYEYCIYYIHSTLEGLLILPIIFHST